jgi:hypothetical protein
MLLGKVIGFIPSPWSGVRLRYKATANLCTYGHPIMFYLGEPLPRGPLHIDVGMELWVPQHRTTVRDMTAEAAGQRLVANINHGFGQMTLEPGAKPQAQTIALGPPKAEELRARAGDKVSVRLALTRGRARKLKATISPAGRRTA